MLLHRNNISHDRRRDRTVPVIPPTSGLVATA